MKKSQAKKDQQGATRAATDNKGLELAVLEGDSPINQDTVEESPHLHELVFAEARSGKSILMAEYGIVAWLKGKPVINNKRLMLEKKHRS